MYVCFVQYFIFIGIFSLSGTSAPNRIVYSAVIVFN
jgi:hypothetical protein